MHAYIALCLVSAIRTEARALRWEHIDFGDPAARPSQRSRIALRAIPRGHQDREITQNQCAPPDGRGRTQAADRAASRLSEHDSDEIVFGRGRRKPSLRQRSRALSICYGKLVRHDRSYQFSPM